ncbi:MAG: hypothetical protein CVU46_02830 [Chloroflexi bacterium HGW-Chloroflexi-8]|nr:MAG: hypothetical protein CVU46_02830 [Chloroflexi bacterium HGW-Chloroflexi-8]
MNSILYNARIYTMDQENPFVEAIAIRNSKIIAIGSNEEILNLANDQFQKINIDGKTILPGFSDSHIHLNYYSKSLTQVDCETISKADCLERIRARVNQTEPGKWIIGHGWNQNNWPEGYGTIDDLDQISTEHPIYLTAKSLHASWANSKALELAGIDLNHENPPNGIIGKNNEGNLNGLLFESATQLIEKIITAHSVNQIAQNLEIAQKELLKYGITSVHDFDGADCFSALQKLEREARLKIRVLKSIQLDNLEAAVNIGMATGFGSDYLRIGSVKLFADGALGPQTAAMISPYENSSTNKGVLSLSSDQIFDYGKLASQSGISLAIHAIGDMANMMVLQGFERLRSYEQEMKLPHLNHRIEHVQILTKEIVGKLSDLDLTASVQPIHLISDMEAAEKYWGSRSMYAYPFHSLLISGTNMVFGSDSPVESPNPFLGIYAATTRRRLDGAPGENGWFPEQKISLLQAINAYTRAPAYLAGWKSYKGRISPNEQADLIVLPEDIFNISPDKIKNLLPQATMVAGQWVWQK